METLKNFASIPQGKIDEIKIACQAKQIEALDIKATEIAGELDNEREAVVLAKAEIKTLTQNSVDLVDAHKVELAEASEVTQKAVSAKAAELIAESGTPAADAGLNDNPSNPSANNMTKEDAEIGYKALKDARDFQGAQDFFAEHYNLLT
jgi:hypothetical protein